MPYIYESSVDSPTQLPFTSPPAATMSPCGKKSTRPAKDQEINISTSKLGRFFKSSSREIDPTRSINAPARRPANSPTLSNPFPRRSSQSAGLRATDEPPAYTPPPPSYTAPAVSVAPTTDNPYAFLGQFDTIFLIDDSGSMSGAKWRETADALRSITPICTKQDSDGIDIHFLNSPDSPTYHNITSESKVQQIFDRVRPGGGTPTGQRLNAILKPYLRKLEARGAGRFEDAEKPLNIIVITDGEAHDDPESVILQAAKKLDKLDAPAWQVGIQFFQVGSDPEATKALQDLDDGLVELGCERDIVDTVPWRGAESGMVGLNADGILKVVLGAVNRRLDRKRNSAEWRR